MSDSDRDRESYPYHSERQFPSIDPSIRPRCQSRTVEPTFFIVPRKQADDYGAPNVYDTIVYCMRYLLRYPLLRQDVQYDLLDQGSEALGTAPTKCRHNALLHVLANHIDLDVGLRTYGLLAKGDLLLGMLDEHNAEPALRVVDASDREGSAINSDIAFRDEIRQKRWACGSRFR